MDPRDTPEDSAAPGDGMGGMAVPRGNAGRRQPPRGLALALILPILAAGSQAAEVSEEAELRDLLTLLDHQTELATRTGLNADFIPGMATILSGEDLLLGGHVPCGRPSPWSPASARGSRSRASARC